jgi:hypothetical protein
VYEVFNASVSVDNFVKDQAAIDISLFSFFSSSSFFCCILMIKKCASNMTIQGRAIEKKMF